MKRALTAIEMDSGLMEAVRQGHKLVTIRENKRDYQNGDKMMIVDAEDMSAPVRVVVTAVTHTTLGQVEESVMRSDMFMDRDHMLQGMREFYPKIQFTSQVTVIRWRLQ